jgi:hypothetical protein
MVGGAPRGPYQKPPKPPTQSKTTKTAKTKSDGNQRKWQGVPLGSGGGFDGIERKLGGDAPGEFVCLFVCLFENLFVCVFVCLFVCFFV